MRRLLRCLIPAVLTAHTLLAGDTFIEKGQNGWKYWDKAEPPEDDWVKPAFDDSAWKTGQAPLGYGDRAVKTELDFGSDDSKKHPAAYLRLQFEVKDPKADEIHYLRIRMDDGVTLFLNGKPAGVLNIPRGFKEGAYTGSSLGPGVLPEYHGFIVKPGRLIKGTNTLAVVIHQGSAGSSDLFFDLEIKGMTKDEAKEANAAEVKEKAARAEAEDKAEAEEN